MGRSGAVCSRDGVGRNSSATCAGAAAGETASMHPRTSIPEAVRSVAAEQARLKAYLTARLKAADIQLVNVKLK